MVFIFKHKKTQLENDSTLINFDIEKCNSIYISIQ